ncbi:MAG: alanine:cation symporter family protein [archaeon]|nr:alanine:cation symporter family protein [archaeon]
MSLIETADEYFCIANSYFWGITFVFLIGLGLVFTFKLKGLQLLKIKETSTLALSGVSEGKENKRISSFEAFCIGMGARIGVGNIAGVGAAIAAGGPGAIFWMWIFAIIGSASSFMESTLAQIYKEKKEDGHYYGGPAYYASKGLKSKALGVVVALLMILTFGVGFIAVQANAASSNLCNAFQFDNNNYVFAAIIAIVAAILIFKGLKLIAAFASKVVPIMAVAWIVFAIIMICMNIGNVPNAFYMIFANGLAIDSVIGGGLGIMVVNGLKRGVFSNEAGLGSVANVAASADVKHPVKQGLIQSFGVLVDTLLVCTLSALVILTVSDSWTGIVGNLGGSGKVFVSNAANIAFDEVGKIIVALFLCVFAFTSLIGYYTMSESNARFIKDDKKVILCVKALVIIIAFWAAAQGIGGSPAEITFMDDFSDTFMALMGAVNIFIVALLSRQVFAAYADYRAQKKAGIEEPEFHRSVLDNADGVTEWE